MYVCMYLMMNIVLYVHCMYIYVFVCVGLEGESTVTESMRDTYKEQIL